MRHDNPSTQIQEINGQEQLEGSVENVVFQNEDNSFVVFRLKTNNNRFSQALVTTVTIVGNFPAPFLGEELALTGKWVEHARFGRQFKADNYRRIIPTTTQAIEKFLSSGAIKGIGKTMATGLVKEFGGQTLEIIELYPDRLTKMTGIGKKKAQAIHNSYLEQAGLREVMLFLETHGITGAYAARIYDAYGRNSLEMIKADPYQMTEQVRGIGFGIADQIAMALGIPEDHPSRLTAGINFALLKLTQFGHCCTPEEMLVEKTAQLLSQDAYDIGHTISKNIAQNKLYTEDYHGMNLIYPGRLYLAEKEVAERLKRLKLKVKNLSLKETDIEERVDNWESAESVLLSPDQRAALKAALKYGVMVLTGGPGTGKTTIVKGILALLEEQGLKIMLGAPTGRAAKRLSETTGREARTVHKLLEAGLGFDEGGEPVFLKDEDDLLDADAIILDETSMMDVMLMSSFLKAAPDGCRVILVGDADQLPSVGPGAVLKDIIRSDVIPVVKLTEVFRQAGQSVIVLNAHRINQGLLPDFGLCPDFQFREIDDPEATAQAIVKLCADELKNEGFDPLREIQILSPMHNQVCGVENLNRLLQAALNPQAKESLVTAGQCFKEGDKVMQVRNNYLKRVFNGDIGFILAIEEGSVLVRYPEDDVLYERGEHNELTLSYAMSVHKSQGSEYQVIIMPLVLGHRIMLQRNLLYTAATRAKERVILLGSKNALQTAVLNDRTRRRYSLLAERLRGDSLC